ncbi:MAG: transcription-repair coupling factor [Gammaproteobacteria bacterium]|nr:transcription-repair coupling factor [Gammaproteobacteria bacterium]
MNAADNAILDLLEATAPFRSLRARLPTAGHEVRLGGTASSLGHAVLATLARATGDRVVVLLAPSPDRAVAAEADLEALAGPDSVAAYPQREALPYESDDFHIEIEGRRVEAVEAVFGNRCRLLVTTPRALQERASFPTRLTHLHLTLRTGDEVGLTALVEKLGERGFHKAPLVEEVGQFAVRGGIVDVFSFGSPDPLRIEFLGDEIGSMRRFDIFDQRSTGSVAEVRLLPVRLDDGGGADAPGPSRSLLDLLPGDTLVARWADDDLKASADHTWREVERRHAEAVAGGDDPPPPDTVCLRPGGLLERLATFPRLALSPAADGRLLFDSEAPPAISRDMKRLRQVLRDGAARGDRTLILCDNDGQIQRLEEILGGQTRLPAGTQLAVGALERGFTLNDSVPRLRILTDHEIFLRTRRIRRRRRFRGSASLENVAQLTPGDAVVHMDHGIGRFRGLEHVTIGGEEIESILIEYAGAEFLRVPVYRLDLLERWVGSTEEAEPPPVHRIGGKRWKNLRARTERAIRKVATELLELYARREMAQGHAFAPDTRWQKEMESSFLYEDTRDQRRVVEDIKRDMEAAAPMDRLVCGDVGYGKTEVAIRAAFKAVQDGKQVAVLAPTTVLVEQHARTFGERLADYPVTVGALNRFRSAKETTRLLREIRRGTLDVAIGTHRLLSKDVDFRDLGLLVVDEEQRFGVRHKERLKRLRAAVDVLTLTATPIPRTLQLSLAGLRNLSLIRTPPRDRVPITTHVIPWNDHILYDGLSRELDRGGQVFFLHNRVQTIHSTAEKVRALAPDAAVAVAHGQMGGRQLDRVMLDFVNGDLDVLVCTAIIENGLDVPNANTLIVDRADRFGLAQLYQIRGRVGRSDRHAHCYLVVPDGVSRDAMQRVRVLERHTDLGSGYAVAMRDLEMRGAGNLLGEDQSGYAQAVGVDTYMRLLRKTVEQMKRGRTEEPAPRDPEISLAGSAYLPDGYVPDSGQKLHLYRRLSRITTKTELDEFAAELRDRFGALPPPADRLLDSHVLRLLGRGAGLQRILVRGRRARLTFRDGLVPRLTALEEPLRDRLIAVEVRRMSPLSLVLRQEGADPLTATLIRALDLLSANRARAA